MFPSLYFIGLEYFFVALIIMWKKFPVFKAGEKYVFNRVFGFTYSVVVSDESCADSVLRYDASLPECVKNPFLLHRRTRQEVPRLSRWAKCYARLLVFLWKYCYPAVYLLSHCRFAVYDDAGVANMAFRAAMRGANQRVLCLPRSVFIATTSKRFKEHGAMFIGCFFPFRHMHAWVIEDDMQADVFDNNWIMFTPLAMMER